MGPPAPPLLITLRQAWAGLRPALWHSLPAALPTAFVFAVVAVLDQVHIVAAWNRVFSMWLQGPTEYPLSVVGFITDWLFSAQVILGLAALGCLIFILKRRWPLAASILLVFPLVLVETILKLVIDQPPASTFLQVRVLFRSSDVHLHALEHGFPSGHAARIGFAIGWLALLLVPQRYRPATVSAIVVVTLFVAWTRIYVGDHSLLEIVAGLLLAAVFLPLAGALMALPKRPSAR